MTSWLNDWNSENAAGTRFKCTCTYFCMLCSLKSPLNSRSMRPCYPQVFRVWYWRYSLEAHYSLCIKRTIDRNIISMEFVHPAMRSRYKHILYVIVYQRLPLTNPNVADITNEYPRTGCISMHKQLNTLLKLSTMSERGEENRSVYQFTLEIKVFKWRTCTFTPHYINVLTSFVGEAWLIMNLNTTFKR